MAVATRHFLRLISIIAASLAVTSAFYLPGVAPTDYRKGDKVDLLVNALSSNQEFLPFDFYYEKFHFCKPQGGAPISQSESLGSILFGDRIFTSPFNLKMLQNENCSVICKSTVPKGDVPFIHDRIRESYSYNWLVDGLPAARAKQDNRSGEIFYSIGFELGKMDRDGNPTLHNHFDIHIEYHEERHDHGEPTYRVVGVLVWPYSKNTSPQNNGTVAKCMENDTPLRLSETQDNEVTYTYTLYWAPSDVMWATRWDNYLHVFDPKIHWFSIINAIVIVLFLTGMVAMILMRALHKDITRYNILDAQEDAQEDFGWKLVHGDVFRPPPQAMLLSVYVGNGTQLILMSGITLAFAVLGFLSPSNRGSLMTVMLMFWVVFSYASGFVSARMYKMFGGECWKQNVGFSAFLLPGALFISLLILNIFLIGETSSGAVPFGTMFALIALWFLVSVPSSFTGSYQGFKRPKIEAPVRTNQIPRQVPEQVWYLRPIPLMLMGGVLPFGSIFIELFFILKSLWYHQVYYVFGFLFLVYLILILTCAEVSILMCYFQLCAEDYNWWWRSFFTSGASAFYMFMYTILYYFTQLEVKSFISTILYFGWSAIMSSIFFVLTGTIGFFSCLVFVRKIYASIKID